MVADAMKIRAILHPKYVHSLVCHSVVHILHGSNVSLTVMGDSRLIVEHHSTLHSWVHCYITSGHIWRCLDSDAVEKVCIDVVLVYLLLTSGKY